MNILFWVLQVLLALHTIMGAVWKFSNTEQATGSLSTIPHALWLTLAVVEFVCALCLVVVAVKKSWGKLVPLAAFFLTLEMVGFSLVNLLSGKVDYSQITYWMVVAVISGFLAYGRYRIKPL